MLINLAQFKKYILAFFDSANVLFGYLVVSMLFSSNSAVSGAHFWWTVYIACAVYFLVLYLLRVYNNILRFSSVREYFICYMGCVLSSVIMTLLRSYFPFILPYYQNFSAGILIGVFAVGTRVAARVYLNHAIPGTDGAKDRLLIIGAGAAGNMVIRDLFFGKDNKFHIVGLIDDDRTKKGCTISGIKVVGNRYDIQDICKNCDVDIILFAIPTADSKNKKEIIELCKETRCKVRSLPAINDLILTKRLVDNIRDLDVSDLLSRDPVELDNDYIKQYIQDQVVLVTGGGGSIGSELCRQIAKYDPKKLLILDIYENNAYDIENELRHHFPNLTLEIVIASVCDRSKMESVFQQHRPYTVFHAAAHKHVPLMERNPCEAVKNNVFGTLNVAQCSDRFNTKKFILISTDKAVNPTNVMGATKRMCEMIIQSINGVSRTEFVAVRFGNVLGSNGSVIPLFKQQIKDGGPVTVTHKNITRFFMTIPEAAQLVLQAATYAQGGEIFVLDMGEPVKIYELAENVIRLSGLRPHDDIEIKITGLRPGEKLYEEILMADEGLEKTSNEKIYIAKPTMADFQELLGQFEKLSRVVQDEDDERIVAMIGNIVPTYLKNYDAQAVETAEIGAKEETCAKCGVISALTGTAQRAAAVPMPRISLKKDPRKAAPRVDNPRGI